MNPEDPKEQAMDVLKQLAEACGPGATSAVTLAGKATGEGLLALVKMVPCPSPWPQRDSYNLMEMARLCFEVIRHLPDEVTKHGDEPDEVASAAEMTVQLHRIAVHGILRDIERTLAKAISELPERLGPHLEDAKEFLAAVRACPYAKDPIYSLALGTYDGPETGRPETQDPKRN